jgi:hypothetical protein
LDICSPILDVANALVVQEGSSSPLAIRTELHVQLAQLGDFKIAWLKLRALLVKLDNSRVKMVKAHAEIVKSAGLMQTLAQQVACIVHLVFFKVDLVRPTVHRV